MAVLRRVRHTRHHAGHHTRLRRHARHARRSWLAVRPGCARAVRRHRLHLHRREVLRRCRHRAGRNAGRHASHGNAVRGNAGWSLSRELARWEAGSRGRRGGACWTFSARRSARGSGSCRSTRGGWATSTCGGISRRRRRSLRVSDFGGIAATATRGSTSWSLRARRGRCGRRAAEDVVIDGSKLDIRHRASRRRGSCRFCRSRRRNEAWRCACVARRLLGGGRSRDDSRCCARGRRAWCTYRGTPSTTDRLGHGHRRRHRLMVAPSTSPSSPHGS